MSPVNFLSVWQEEVQDTQVSFFSVNFLLTAYEGKGILKEEILDNIDKELGFLQRKKVLLNNTSLQEGK